jgi:hypothetical protein
MDTAKRLEEAVATLDRLIALARECGLADSAQFLAMAKLSLLMDINGIGEQELRAVCAALETGGTPDKSRPGGLTPLRLGLENRIELIDIRVGNKTRIKQ